MAERRRAARDGVRGRRRRAACEGGGLRAFGRVLAFWGDRGWDRRAEAPKRASRAATTTPEHERPSLWLDRGLALVPLLFGLPVLAGIGLSLVGLLGTELPDPGPGQQVNTDAAALGLGQPLYQDPAAGYTGILYTPGLPLAVGVLQLFSTWAGWPLLIAVLSGVVLLALAARVAYAPRSPRGVDRALGLLEALGVGALAWALVASIQFNGLYGASGLHDAVAWMPAVLGLALLPAAVSGSGRRLVLSVLLLSTAFWTKQNTIAASMAAALWLGMAASAGAVPPRRALGACAGLMGVNLAVLGALNLLTAGWELHFNFGLPAAHPLGELGGNFPANFPRFLREDLLPATALALVFAGVTWGAVAWEASRHRGGGGPRRLRRLPARAAAEIRRPATLGAGMVVLVLVALAYRRAGALNLYFLTAPSERLSRFVDSLLVPGLVLLLSFLAAAGLVTALRRLRLGTARRRAGQLAAWLRRASEEERLATLLLSVLVVGVVTAFYFRQKKGADDHYYIGIAWALALLGAMGYRRARARSGAAPVAAALVALLFLAALVVSPSRQTDARANAVNLPSLARVTPGGAHPEHSEWLTVFFPAQGLLPIRRWSEQGGSELRDYARSHEVWDADLGDVNVATRGTVWQNFDNVYGEVAAGGQPLFLIQAWLDRRFDAVSYPLPTAEDRELANYSEGRLEENYFWKLNEVIAARYQPSSRVPEGHAERRPGSERAPWMRRCFGPFAMAGASFAINHGGGFWCRPGPQPRLTLAKTPAPYSDVRTVEPVVAAAGEIEVGLPARRGLFDVVLERAEGGPPLRLRGEPGRGGALVLSASRGAVQNARVVVPDAQSVRLLLEPGGGDRLELRPAATGSVRLGLPPLGGGAVLRLGASRDSRATFDLDALRLR